MQPAAETAKLVIGDVRRDLPVEAGTEGSPAIDVSQLYAQTGYITLDSGYANTAAVRSAVTFLDGERGILRYRGYPVEELAERCDFTETAYLLIYGELPTEEQCAQIDAKPVRGKTDAWYRHFHGLVVERYQAQQKGTPVYSMELHTLRLGDVALATNPFELYLDYGVQVQARSPAPQTILIQLATSGRQHAYYVPTPRAVRAGGYSAEVTHNIVGPEGAQVLVDRTVEEIGALFDGSAARP